MNFTILNQYNLEMRKGEKEFDVYISGDSIGNYLYGFRLPKDVELFISDVNLAINGNYSQIEDPDYGNSFLGSYWYAWITPTHFELWQNSSPKRIIPLEDWKEILLSWKECLEG